MPLQHCPLKLAQFSRAAILLRQPRCYYSTGAVEHSVLTGTQTRLLHSKERGFRKPIRLSLYQLQHFSSSDSSSTGGSTIYALSTAPGRAAIAIIRVSGPAARDIYHGLCPGRPLPKPRSAAFRPISDPEQSSKLLDSGALLLYFPSPNTVTGEDVLELHVHGGPAVVRSILSAIPRCATSGPIKYAEPGEFTKRAFLNDRLSLTQVEALGDTLSAVTEEQRRVSVHGTRNGLSQRYEQWRKMLLYARGELEALIDFSEDQHFDESPADLAGDVALQIRQLLSTIRLHHANAVRGELLRNGISIALIGSPNVGKSSLLNHLVGRNAAIVSREAGTTRDVVEIGVDIGGFFCRIGDTAGLRRTMNGLRDFTSVVGEVEQEGIARAKAAAFASDIVILVLSVERCTDGQGHALQLDAEVLDAARLLLQSGKPVLVAVNKVDNYGSQAAAMAVTMPSTVSRLLPGISTDRIFSISCHTAATAAATAAAVTDPAKSPPLTSRSSPRRPATASGWQNLAQDQAPGAHRTWNVIASHDSHEAADTNAAVSLAQQLGRPVPDTARALSTEDPASPRAAGAPAGDGACGPGEATEPSRANLNADMPRGTTAAGAAGGAAATADRGSYLASIGASRPASESAAGAARVHMWQHVSAAATPSAQVQTRWPTSRIDDAGGVQALVAGLTATFRDITAALTPQAEAGDQAFGAGADTDAAVYVADASVWEESLGATERQRMLLQECEGHLLEFLECVEVKRTESAAVGEEKQGSGAVVDDENAPGREVDIVVAAECLRDAAGCLGRITGRGEQSDVEEVLGVVFER